MSKRESTARQNLIIQRVRKSPATFDEILEFLEMEAELNGYNYRISKRTFQRDLEDIRSLHSIDIQYNVHKRAYCVDFDNHESNSSRILEAFDVFNALNLADRLSEHIHFQDRKPSGTENLHGLLHAIKKGVRIRFKHQKYWDDKNTRREVEPYAIKEFKSRWYLVAKDMKDDLVKTFGLDRLSELDFTRVEFDRPTSFNVADYFKHCFGIIVAAEQEPQEVVLSFTPVQGRYIKSMPLHHSQKVLVDNDQELRLRLWVYVTYDLILEILSHGENVKVISPQSLVDEIKESLMQNLKQYG